MKIIKVQGREVLDSRGNPTVEAEISIIEDFTYDKTITRTVKARAIVPSGASTGEKEAVELRDNDPERYKGKGVTKAVSNINTIIARNLTDKAFQSQQQLDDELKRLDGTPDKSVLGANAILAVSMAFARVMAAYEKMPLYRYLGPGGHYTLPVPCMNVINGGRHADNNVDFQEFMIAPHNAPSFREAIRMGEETFHTLKNILKAKGYFTGVGDEGGFAPNLKSNEEAVEVILEAITKAGYRPGADISICLDPATSEMWEDGKYVFFKSTGKSIDSGQLLEIWEKMGKPLPHYIIGRWNGGK